MLRHGRRTLTGNLAELALASSLTFAVALSGCSATPESSLPDSPSAAIPIRRVVLYQNGVGYFERRGHLEGNVLRLEIRPSQVNDLLKSLTVIDTREGRAVSVSLPLEKSGDRVLAELPSQVRDAGGVLGVLRAFRGARVEVVSKVGDATGRIVGVENIDEGAGKEVVPEWRATLRTDDGELVVIPVKSIQRIQIEDRVLAVGLEQSLDVALKEGDWKPVTLAIRLAGEGEHELLASYIIEMPRWKPAYRLVTGGDKPLLQGWAVVDNVSGEDWTDVQLSLVAGTPMSFVYDLHSTQYTVRPDLTPRRPNVALAPPAEPGGVMLEDEEAPPPDEKARAIVEPQSMGAGAGAGEGYGYSFEDNYPLPAAPPPPPPEPMDALLERQAAPEAAGQTMGSLFRYDLPDRVTVPDRSSTLVAIVNQRVDAEEVVYFRPEETGSGGHPYRAVRFSNDTPFTLEQGPVTLYSKGTFVGEGFLNRVDPGTTHMVTYAVEDKVSMDSDFTTKEEGGQLVRIVDGQLTTEVTTTARTTYTVRNVSKEPITAYIKTEKRPDWKLDHKPAGTIDTVDSLLVPVKVPAEGSAKSELAWVKSLERSITIDTSLSTEVLQVYLSGGKVPPEIKDKLTRILDLKRKVAETDAETARLRKQHDDASRDQDRVRANLDTLRKSKGNHDLEQQLAKKLAELETELGTLSGKLVRLSEERATLERDMVAIIRTVTLER